MRTSYLHTVFKLLVVWRATPQESPQFPLQDCSTDATDLLVVVDMSSQLDCVDMQELSTFFSGIIDMFLTTADKLPARFRVNFVSYSSPSSQESFHYDSSINSWQIRSNMSITTNCTKSTSNRRRKKATILPVVDFIYSYFTGQLEKKGNDSQVAFMVIKGPNSRGVEEVDKVQSGRYNQTSIKMFVILINFVEEAQKIARIPNTIHITSFSDLASKQFLPMSVCKKCKQGWFAFEHRNSLNLISCYFLDIDTGRLNDWFQASSRCEKLGSNLASVETKEELDFLEERLLMSLINKGEFKDGVNIFVGLRRDRETLFKRFRWLSGNPLIKPHWAHGSPNGGYIQGCGLWAFEATGTNLTLNFTAALNVSQYKRDYMNGWKDIGCGVPISRVSLCEVVLGNSTSDWRRPLDIKRAHQSRISNVIKRGEFTIYKDQVVSIPAFVENVTFYNSLEDGFEMFNCEEEDGKGKSIPYSYVCDHVHHCNNDRDESHCSYRRCDPSLEFECRSRQCVPLESLCDVYSDCFDSSDEIECVECKQRRRCEGTCVPKHWFHDKEIDCSGCFDDHFYRDENTHTNEDDSCAFICNRTSCVYPFQLGDGILDCTGPEGPLDETIGKLEKAFSCFAKDGEVRWAPRCVYVKDRYGSILGCRDMSHLWDCQNFPCPEGYAKCPDSYCIPVHLVRDGKRDCPVGEDEEYAEDHNCVGNFACFNSHVCLHPDLVCDGDPQCPSRDDELNCHTTCANGFRCIAGTVAVMDYDKKIPLKSLAFIDHRTRYLDLSGIDISDAIIEQDVTHLGNLITTLMSNCKLTTVDGIFGSDISNLQSVYTLDLSYNLLKEISTQSVFRYMSNLHILNLSHNTELAVLEDKAFLVYSGESLLECLDLHNTGITALRSSVLRGLNNLKVLNLSNTLIRNLFEDSFPKDFTLQILDLRDTSILGFDSNSFNGLFIQQHLYTDNFGLCCSQITGNHIPAYTCHSPAETISSCSHLVREDIQRVLLWVVGIVAVLGNVTVILCRVVLDKGVIKKAYGVFVTNLGISDLIMGLYLLIIACADLYYKDNYVLNGKIWKESAICQVAGFLSTLSCETSAFFILLVTLDRYLVMKFPFGQCNFSKRGSIVASALAWITGLMLALLPLLPMFSNWSVYSSNGMCLGLPLNADKLAGWRYSISVFVVLNTIMFIIIVAGQFSIYRAMADNRAATSSVQNGNRRAQDVAVAKQLSLVVLSDFLCWFPIGIMGLLALTGHEIGKNAYTWSAVLVLPVNSALNPLLYTVPVIQGKWKQFINDHSKHQSKEDKRIRQPSDK